MSRRRIYLALAGVVGLAAAGLGYLHQVAASGHPELDETEPVEMPGSLREGRPDIWPGLVALAGEESPPDPALSSVLAATGVPDAATLDGLSLQPAGLKELQAMSFGESTIRVPVESDGGGEWTEASGVASDTHASLRRLADAQLALGWQLALDGDADAGTAEMVSVMQMGHLLIGGESDLVTAMTGIQIAHRAARELRELLEGPARGDAEAMSRAAAALGAMGELSPARGIAAEWLQIDTRLQTMPAPVSLASLYPSGEGTGQWAFADRVVRLVPDAFDRDQTLAWSRVEGQRAVEQASLPRWERPRVCDGPTFLHWSPYGGLTTSSLRHGLGELLHNPLGRGTLDVMLPCYASVVTEADVLRAETRVLETWVAVQRQMLETGQAHDLSTLAPRWLGAVPTDPFDGQPIRVEHGAVFSAGWNADVWSEDAPSTDGRRGSGSRPRPGLHVAIGSVMNADGTVE